MLQSSLETDRDPAKRLDRNGFAAALRKGLGRALLYVKHYGLDEVADLVLEACIHNQVYDQQCESGRSSWLYSMFAQTPYYTKFRDAILAALEKGEADYSLWQLCQLGKEMAMSGDDYARQLLKEFVFRMASRTPEEDWIGVDEWIELEGANGMLELARIYGQRLLSNPQDSPVDCLLQYQTPQGFAEILRQHIDSEPALKAYWDYVEKQGKTKAIAASTVDKEAIKKKFHERVRRKYTLDRILSDAKSGKGNYPGHYTQFGRHATAEELEKVFNCLLNETEDKVRVRLLWVFRRTPLPGLSDMLFNWALGEHDALTSAAIAALAQVSDQRVHHLAKEKVETGNILGANRESIDLFLHNYEDSDAQIIARSLASVTPSADDAHALGSSVIKLAKKFADVKLADGLKWVYENTPCTNCRYQTIVQLDRVGQLSGEILYECQYDSEEEIRKFVIQRSALASTGLPPAAI